LTAGAARRIPAAVAQDFTSRLAYAQEAVPKAIARILEDAPTAGRPAAPARLHLAMRYAALSGGKRYRPFVMIEAARIFGKVGDGVIRAAAALECIHCYSLVHDDLPAMDDDDLRRGKPTVHRAFNEATAILAGDALLTLAFAILADPATDPDADARLALVAGLADAAGYAGMAGGQMLDLSAASETADDAAVMRLQAMKTGALFRYAAEAGAILGRATASERTALVRYGEFLGLAFQLADDLIDATGSADAAGKATAKDAAKGKATLIALHGVPIARARLGELTVQATTALSPFGERGATLAALARAVGAQQA
jgi:farnesyl diphosphate synthase